MQHSSAFQKRGFSVEQQPAIASARQDGTLRFISHKMKMTTRNTTMITGWEKKRPPYEDHDRALRCSRRRRPRSGIISHAYYNINHDESSFPWCNMAMAVAAAVAWITCMCQATATAAATPAATPATTVASTRVAFVSPSQLVRRQQQQHQKQCRQQHDSIYDVSLSRIQPSSSWRRNMVLVEPETLPRSMSLRIKRNGIGSSNSDGLYDGRMKSNLPNSMAALNGVVPNIYWTMDGSRYRDDHVVVGNDDDNVIDHVDNTTGHKVIDDSSPPSSSLSLGVGNTRDAAYLRKRLLSPSKRKSAQLNSSPLNGNIEVRKTIGTERKSRTSTMPGFRVMSDKQRVYESGTRLAEQVRGNKIVETPALRQKRRKDNSETMYRNSASVPDSLIQFADEIHQEDRISRNEEIELGEKTQEAIRIKNLYDILESHLGREPTDEEWCAAAGKINMETIRQTLEEGIDAKNKLVTSNLRMVQSVVNTYIRNGLSGKYNAADMMQEGILALIRAAEKFEPDRGWKFSTYAMYWVRASVKRSQIQQSRIITVPQRLFENRKRLMRIEHEMIRVLGRKPTYQELGDAVGMTPLQVERCITAMDQRCLSLDQTITNVMKPGSETNRDTLVEIVGPKLVDGSQEELMMDQMRHDLIETLHRHLSPQEVQVLLLRFGLEDAQILSGRQHSTIMEICKTMGLSPDKVRRMINKSLKRLQAAGLDEWKSYYARELS